MIVTARSESAKHLREQLEFWAADPTDLHLFPEPDVRPYERQSWGTSVALDRLRVLDLLTRHQSGAPIVVLSLSALMVRTPTKEYFSESSRVIKLGTKVDPSALLEWMVDLGYEADTAVEVPRTFSRRGGIIDLFSPAEEYPVRLEFFGNEVESLRAFNPKDQRSIGPVDSTFIIPARESLLDGAQDLDVPEMMDGLGLSACSPDASERIEEDLNSYILGSQFEGRESYAHLFLHGTFFDYIPKDTLMVLDDMTSLKSAYQDMADRAEQLKDQRVEEGELPRTFPKPYPDWEEIAGKLDGSQDSLCLDGWERDGQESHRFSGFVPAPNFSGHLKIFLRDLRGLLDAGVKVAIVSHQASRLSELLEDVDIRAPVSPDVTKAPLRGAPVLMQGSLAEGWILNRPDGSENAPLALLTDKEIFGFTKQRRATRKRPVRQEAFVSELTVGDHVVHVDHGIGRFVGVTTMRRDEGEREYLTLEYADGAKLYVPNDSVDRVSPYIGPGDRPPPLTRLGSQEWSRAKRKVKESAEAIAKELLALYARREVKTGYAFSPDSAWLQELEASFPYVETPDQLETIREVKVDMERPRPMDRLVCGDVGYGKTEVALRAAFKAVLDGRQVALLVPTTVLAQQHFQTFQERLKAFPVEIEVLSRFRSQKDQKKVVERLEAGTVDICIGTHRLLQKDVRFKDLGLVIIDEEQRFGVTHKERLKRMREQVDVLTLSATPIPRTLHMSLVGVRDMSTMETPPEERLPIKTYVQEYSDDVVREAIMREIERGGQIFFVHNRVQTIEALAQRLRRLVPNAQIVVAHGQMPENQLESVMVDFVDGQYDVLVCTTIIESGLDMPNVNTIIVRDSDRMGLSQLYQLRGRVGRGTDRAYAYFLFDGYKSLSEVAEKRLKAIQAATELGAGFRIAMKDLEIRGAGNLLGVEQSGHIASVGFDLYCSMLAQAVEELRAQGEGALVPGDLGPSSRRAKATSIDLPIPAYLPQDYVSALDVRLALYQRLARVTSIEGVEDMAKEIEDRFGRQPPEVVNLLYLVRIKALASSRGIARISREAGQLVVVPGHDATLDRGLLAGMGPGIEAGATRIRLELAALGEGWRGTLERVIQTVSPGEAPISEAGAPGPQAAAAYPRR